MGIARIAVKKQCPGFQNVLEFFLPKLDGLIVVVGTDNFKGMTGAHERSSFFFMAVCGLDQDSV
jgi:hypothetical protein